MGDTNIYQYMNAPFFNWLVDHPCTCLPQVDSDVPNYHIICLDRDHVKYIKNNLPRVKYAHFIPLGGIQSNLSDHSFEQFHGREYDISFVGSYFSLEQIGNEIADLPDSLKNASFQMIEFLLDNRDVTYEMACKLAYDDNLEARDFSFPDFTYATSRVNRYITAYMR